MSRPSGANSLLPLSIGLFLVAAVAFTVLAFAYLLHPARQGASAVTVELAEPATSETLEHARLGIAGMYGQETAPFGLGATRVTISDPAAGRILVESPRAVEKVVADLDALDTVLELRLVEEELGPAAERAAGVGCEPMRDDGSQPCYRLALERLIGNDDLQSANAAEGSFGETMIHVRVTEEAGERMHRATSTNDGRRLAILVDGEVVSAPVVHGAIRDEMQIAGLGTKEDAERLARVLNFRRELPPLRVVAQESVPPERWLASLWLALVVTGLVALGLMIGVVGFATRRLPRTNG